MVIEKNATTEHSIIEKHLKNLSKDIVQEIFDYIELDIDYWFLKCALDKHVNTKSFTAMSSETQISEHANANQSAIQQSESTSSLMINSFGSYTEKKKMQNIMMKTMFGYLPISHNEKNRAIFMLFTRIKISILHQYFSIPECHLFISLIRFKDLKSINFDGVAINFDILETILNYNPLIEHFIKLKIRKNQFQKMSIIQLIDLKKSLQNPGINCGGKIKTLVLMNETCENMSSSDIDVLSKWKDLEILHLPNCTELGDKHMNCIANTLTSLKDLNVYHCKSVTPEGFLSFLQCYEKNHQYLTCPSSKLKRLNIQNTNIKDKTLEQWIHRNHCSHNCLAKHIKKLNLTCSNPKTCISLISQLSSIKSFNCNNDDAPPSQNQNNSIQSSVENLSVEYEKKHLDELVIECNNFEIFRSMKDVASSISALQISYLHEHSAIGQASKFFIDILHHFAQSLRRLNISGQNFVTDKSVAMILGMLCNLEHLDVSYTAITSQIFENTIVCPNMTSLDISGTSIGDDDLQSLFNAFPQLEALNLGETEVSNQVFEIMSNGSNLKKLCLSDNEEIRIGGNISSIQDAQFAKDEELLLSATSMSFEEVLKILQSNMNDRGQETFETSRIVKLIREHHKLTSLDLTGCRVSLGARLCILKHCPSIQSLTFSSQTHSSFAFHTHHVM